MPTSSKPITLIATIGSSPAVLTETLWQLHASGDWPVQKVVVLTTRHGKIEIESSILKFPDGGYFKLLMELGLSPSDIMFDKKDIHVAKGPDGNLLDDLRDRTEDEHFAELVQEIVRNECRNDQTRVFASIAGGRKTMGAHLLASMQIYGRSDDKVLHVLADQPVEAYPDFYYPTKEALLVESRDGAKTLDASTVKLDLIDIPFLRLRTLLERTSLIDFDHSSYGDLMDQIEASVGNMPKTPVFRLIFDIEKRMVFINKLGPENAIRFGKADRPFGLFLYLAIRSKLDNASEKAVSFTFRSLIHNKVEVAKLWLCNYLLSRNEFNSDEMIRELLKEERPITSKTISDIRKILKDGLSYLEQPEIDIAKHLLVQGSARIFFNKDLGIPLTGENIRLQNQPVWSPELDRRLRAQDTWVMKVKKDETCVLEPEHIRQALAEIEACFDYEP